MSSTSTGSSLDLRITKILLEKRILTDNECELYRHLCQRSLVPEDPFDFSLDYSSVPNLAESAFKAYMNSLHTRTANHHAVLTNKVKFKLENILFFDEDVLKKALYKIFKSTGNEWMLPILSLERKGEILLLTYSDGDPVIKWKYPRPFIIDGYEVKGSVTDNDNEFRRKARKILLTKLSNGDNNIKIRYQALAYLLTRNFVKYPFGSTKPTRKDIVTVMYPKNMIPMLYPPKKLPNYLLISNRREIRIPDLVKRYFFCLDDNIASVRVGIYEDTSIIFFPLLRIYMMNFETLKQHRIGFVDSSSIPRDKSSYVFRDLRNLRHTKSLILRCDNIYFPLNLMVKDDDIIPRHYQLVRREDNTVVPFLNNTYYYKDEDGEFIGSSYTCKYQGRVPWEFSQKSNVKFSVIKSLMMVVYCIRNNVGVYVRRNNRFERIGYQTIYLSTFHDDPRYRIVEEGEVKHNVYDTTLISVYLEPDPNGLVFLHNGKYVTQRYFDTIYHQVPGMIETRLFTLGSLNEKYGNFFRSMVDVGFLMPDILRLNQERL